MNELDRFQQFLADEHPELPALPTHKEVCSRCRGEGVLVGFEGVYTQEDFTSGEVDVDEYLDFTRTCEDCNGLRVIEVPTEHGHSEVARLWQEWLRDAADARHIEAMERRMGA